MKYEICEKTLFKARLNKYSQACGQDKNKTIWLHQCNMKLSQRFYGVIGLFEVMLRNAINKPQIGGRFIFIPYGESRRNHIIPARQRSEAGSAAGRRSGVAEPLTAG